MATWRITAPKNMGRVSKGESFIVVTRTTGNPDATDIEEVLYINGYKESGGGTARSYRAAGNWECVKISDDTYPAWKKLLETKRIRIRKKSKKLSRKKRKRRKRLSRKNRRCKTAILAEMIPT